MVAICSGTLIACSIVRPERGGLRDPHLNRQYYETGHYAWPAPLSGTVDSWIRSAFWSTGDRASALSRGVVTEYLWRQSMWLDTHPAMVQAVRNFAKADGDITLFGDYASAPLVALDANVRLANDLADVTAQRFASGQVTLFEVQTMLLSQPHCLILVRENSGVIGSPLFGQFLANHYEELARFESHAGVRHTLHRRRRL